MRCISLWQPWASLMAHGLKRIETRGAGWGKLLATPGPLLIHAAKRWTRAESELSHSAIFYPALDSIGQAPQGFGFAADGMPFGAIIGAVEVVAVLSTDRVKWNPDSRRYFAYDQGGNQLVISSDEKAFGDYSDGRVAIVTRKPKAFRKPIPYTGRQSLFDVPDAVYAEELAFAVGQYHLDNPPV
jgi:hypothetical protein